MDDNQFKREAIRPKVPPPKMPNPQETFVPEGPTQSLTLTQPACSGAFDARRDLLTKVLITTTQDPHAFPSDRVRASQYLEEAGIQVVGNIPLVACR